MGKTKIFAFLKGLLDGGIKVNCPEEKFPGEERIKGKDGKEGIQKAFSEVKSNLEKI